MTALTAAQVDRACGALVGAACGDALGAGYEFGTAPVPPPGEPVRMIGGGLGGFAPGEWTDDTSMTYAVAEVAATGADLRTAEGLDAIAARFADWFAGGPPDVGIQTSQVLRLGGRRPTAAVLNDAAAQVHRRTGRSGGNGSLMRTSPVALAHLSDPAALVEAAVAVSSLTHHDPHAGEACALWCLAIRHAILTSELDIRSGLAALGDSAPFWEARLDEAEAGEPGSFRPNGYVVTALQAAWSAIHHTRAGERSFACHHVADGLEAAIRIGDDTDTVASIAGALLGARWGGSAFPASWRSVVHGWPGHTVSDLADLAVLTVNGGVDSSGWPGCARLDYSGYPGHDAFAVHPHDEGVLLGGAGRLDDLPPQVTVVVSLCRVGGEQVPSALEHVGFRLIDSDEADNPNLEFVIDDAARTVAALRDRGEVVYLHCVAAQSRTPTVAARYSVLRGRPHDQALADVVGALPAAAPARALRAALQRL